MSYSRRSTITSTSRRHNELHQPSTTQRMLSSPKPMAAQPIQTVQQTRFAQPDACSCRCMNYVDQLEKKNQALWNQLQDVLNQVKDLDLRLRRVETVSQAVGDQKISAPVYQSPISLESQRASNYSTPMTPPSSRSVTRSSIPASTPISSPVYIRGAQSGGSFSTPSPGSTTSFLNGSSVNTSLLNLRASPDRVAKKELIVGHSVVHQEPHLLYGSAIHDLESFLFEHMESKLWVVKTIITTMVTDVESKTNAFTSDCKTGDRFRQLHESGTQARDIQEALRLASTGQLDERSVDALITRLLQDNVKTVFPVETMVENAVSRAGVGRCSHQTLSGLKKVVECIASYYVSQPRVVVDNNTLPGMSAPEYNEQQHQLFEGNRRVRYSRCIYIMPAFKRGGETVRKGYVWLRQF